MTFSDATPLGDARAWLRVNAYDGVPCPCCKQFVKFYHRKMTAAVARVLIKMYRAGGPNRDWVNLPAIDQRGGDPAKARYWGLIEAQAGRRPDGSKRNGWWRVTPFGAEFVRAIVKIPKFAYVYNQKCLRLDASEGEVTIREVLGTKFNYDDLMNGQ